MQDNSANKLQCASLLKFESHYPPLRGIVQLVNSNTLRFRNWSFTIIFNKSYYGFPKLTLLYVMKKRGQSPGLAALCDDGVSIA
jgi:hypothetical protein